MTGIIGLSSRTTPHHIEFSTGIAAYVRCGPDLLLNGWYSDIDGKSRCPVCNRAIRVIIRKKNVVSIEPEETLLYYVEVGGRDKFCIKCESSHLFDRQECFELWRRTYVGPAGSVIAPRKFMVQVAQKKLPHPTI